MSQDVWMSSLIGGIYGVGDKQGLHEKFYGEEWRPAQHEIPPYDDKVHQDFRRHYKGFALKRADFPEALAVFDEKRFKRIGDLFMAGPFYAVKGKLAEVLSRFDLGEGGLIPFPIYRADKVTPVDGEFVLLNFGARKESFLPEESRHVEPFSKDRHDGGRQTWKAKFAARDDDIAVSPAALEGADLWIERSLIRKVFMSGGLVAALRAAKIKQDLDLMRCRILEAGSNP